MAQAQARIYGCEVKFYHLRSLRLTLEQYLRAVEAMQFRHFIVLERRNYLRKIVSSLVARRRGRYHQPAGAEPDLTPITLHLDHVRIDNSDQPLIALLRAYARDLRRLDHLLAGRHVLKLTYEDDVMLGPHRGYRRACEFLGVPEAPVSVNYTRSNPFSLREIISNYNEVAAALADTEFAWMLEAD
jgi:hypothetical protein